MLRAVALASAFSASAFAAAAATIGFMAPLSGPQALVRQRRYDGSMPAVGPLGGRLRGTPTAVPKGDDHLEPEVGQQIVRKRIDKAGADVIAGLSS